MKKLFIFLAVIGFIAICQANNDEHQSSDMKPPGIGELTDQTSYLDVLFKDFANKMEEKAHGKRVPRGIIPDSVSSFIKSVTTPINNLFGKASNLAQNAVNTVKENSQKLKEAVLPGIENVFANISHFLKPHRVPHCKSSEPVTQLTKETIPSFLDEVEQWMQMMNNTIQAGHLSTDEQFCSLYKYFNTILENQNIEPFDLAIRERYFVALDSLAKMLIKEMDERTQTKREDYLSDSVIIQQLIENLGTLLGPPSPMLVQLLEAMGF